MDDTGDILDEIGDIITSRVSDVVEVIESIRCVCVCVCLSVIETDPLVCVCRSTMAKGLWGEVTLQHGSREVRQRSGVFMTQNFGGQQLHYYPTN